MNAFRHQSNAHRDYPMGPSLTVRGSGHFARGLLETAEVDPGGEYFFRLGHFTRRQFGGGARVHTGGPFDVDVAGVLDKVTVDEEAGFFDYDRRSVAGGLGIAIGAERRSSLNYSFEEVPPSPERPEAESRIHTLSAAVEGEIMPLLSGRAAAGYAWRESPRAAPRGRPASAAASRAGPSCGRTTAATVATRTSTSTTSAPTPSMPSWASASCRRGCGHEAPRPVGCGDGSAGRRPGPRPGAPSAHADARPDALPAAPAVPGGDALSGRPGGLAHARAHPRSRVPPRGRGRPGGHRLRQRRPLAHHHRADDRQHLPAPAGRGAGGRSHGGGG